MLKGICESGESVVPHTIGGLSKTGVPVLTEVGGKTRADDETLVGLVEDVLARIGIRGHARLNGDVASLIDADIEKGRCEANEGGYLVAGE